MTVHSINLLFVPCCQLGFEPLRALLQAQPSRQLFILLVITPACAFLSLTLRMLWRTMLQALLMSREKTSTLLPCSVEPVVSTQEASKLAKCYLFLLIHTGCYQSPCPLFALDIALGRLCSSVLPSCGQPAGLDLRALDPRTLDPPSFEDGCNLCVFSIHQEHPDASSCQSLSETRASSLSVRSAVSPVVVVG